MSSASKLCRAVSLRALGGRTLLARRALGLGSNASDNDPVALQRAKERQLDAARRMDDPGDGAFRLAWSEALASDSEAVVKAERCESSSVVTKEHSSEGADSQTVFSTDEVCVLSTADPKAAKIEIEKMVQYTVKRTEAERCNDAQEASDAADAKRE